MISIIDYGVGNIGSVCNMIKKVGGQVEVVKTYEEVLKANKLLLPGVGSFDFGMQSLEDRGLDKAIQKAVLENGSHILGICLGMQLLLNGSAEGKKHGLGLIAGSSKIFDRNKFKIKIPHMGWNEIKATKNNKLFEFDEYCRFYFVHSFYVQCDDFNDIAAFAHYGDDFVAAIERNNVLGVQFHPEKSHKFGMLLMKRFIDL